MTSNNDTMTAMVEYQIRSETTTMDEWLEEWTKRADDAHDFEPQTSAYAAAVNVDDDSKILVFERYEHGNNSLKLHVERPAHATLTETMGAANMTKRRVMSSKYYDVPEFGWWSRPGVAPRAGAIIVVLGFRFADDAQLATYIELMAEHEAYCWENEPDTLIYSAGIANANADRELDLLAGDLLFVMGCTDMDAVNKHANDPRHIALAPKFAEHGIQLVPKFMRTYRTTGNGYLWRD